MIGRNIGEYLKKVRLEKDFQLEKVAYDTRIKKEFLDAIERSDFTLFSSHVHAKGFIKNYAIYLGLDPSGLLAIYKRDYEIKNENRKYKILPARNAMHRQAGGNSKENENEDPNLKLKILKRKFIETLKNTNIRNNVFSRVSLLLILLILVLFLPAIYSKITEKPKLILNYPASVNSGETKDININTPITYFQGETDSGILIKINEVPINLTNGFNFKSDNFTLSNGLNEYVISATNQLGIKSEIRVRVNKLVNQEVIAFIQILGEGVIIDAKIDNSLSAYSTKEGDSFRILGNKEIILRTNKPNLTKLTVLEKEYNLSTGFARIYLQGDDILFQELEEF